ncbi:hypothetical protein Tco_0273374 [Tanacetum coccineum]
MAVTAIMEMVEIEMEETMEMEIQMRMVEVLCQLLVGLTWWNSHKRTIGVDVAFSMTWSKVAKIAKR